MILDRARLAMLRRMGKGDGALLAAMVEGFGRELPRIVEDLRRAVKAGDAPALEAAAHRLRGAAANLGVLDLARLCTEVEERAAAGDVASAAAVEEVVAASAAALEALAGEVEGLRR